MATGKKYRLVNIAEADADVTYGAEEADLINELKDKVNQLAADMIARGEMDDA